MKVSISNDYQGWFLKLAISILKNQTISIRASDTVRNLALNLEKKTHTKYISKTSRKKSNKNKNNKFKINPIWNIIFIKKPCLETESLSYYVGHQ